MSEERIDIPGYAQLNNASEWIQELDSEHAEMFFEHYMDPSAPTFCAQDLYESDRLGNVWLLGLATGIEYMRRKYETSETPEWM